MSKSKSPKLLTMQTATGFAEYAGRFHAYLRSHGAEVLAPTNPPYEISRFRSNGRVAIVYRNERDNTLKFSGPVEEAIQAFVRNDAEWRANLATPRRPGSKGPTVRQLLERDGNRCFFCGGAMPADDATVDHLVELNFGGPNHMANYALMHGRCNLQVAGWPAMDKIRAHTEWQVLDATMVNGSFQVEKS